MQALPYLRAFLSEHSRTLGILALLAPFAYALAQLFVRFI